MVQVQLHRPFFLGIWLSHEDKVTGVRVKLKEQNLR